MGYEPQRHLSTLAWLKAMGVEAMQDAGHHGPNHRHPAHFSLAAFWAFVLAFSSSAFMTFFTFIAFLAFSPS